MILSSLEPTNCCHWQDSQTQAAEEEGLREVAAEVAAEVEVEADVEAEEEGALAVGVVLAEAAVEGKSVPFIHCLL